MSRSANVFPRAEIRLLYGPTTSKRSPPFGGMVRCRNAFTLGETYMKLFDTMATPEGNANSTPPGNFQPDMSTQMSFVLIN